MATYYWVGGNGTWNNSSTANWAATTGGAAGAGPPLVTDNVVFDANSGTGTVDVASGATALAVTLNRAAITLSLSASPTFAGLFTLTTGAVVLNNNTLTVQLFFGDGSATRSIDFGTTGAINVTGNNSINVWYCPVITNFTISGTPTVNLTYAGATGTRQVRHGSGITGTNGINLNVTAGTDIVSIVGASGGTGLSLLNLSFSGFSGTWANPGGTISVFIYGNLTLSSTMVGVYSGAATLRFAGTSVNSTITCAGKTIDSAVLFSGTSSVWTFNDNFAASGTVSLGAGTVNANNKNVSVGAFALLSGTKTLTLGSGTWTVAGNWDANTNVANLTVSASTGTINMTSASSKTFAGGAKTWPTLNQGGAGALTVQQSNTFANITNTVQPATITLTSGTTQTVTDFDASGTSGNLITLNASTPGSRATLTDSGGINSVSYLSITDIAATGYGEWQAYTSNGNVDGGNNVGWVFAEPPPLTASEYQVSFKSFTERRSF